jgi:hypothetical protein
MRRGGQRAELKKFATGAIFLDGYREIEHSGGGGLRFDHLNYITREGFFYQQTVDDYPTLPPSCSKQNKHSSIYKKGRSLPPALSKDV